MHFFTLLQWDFEGFFTERCVVRQGDLAPPLTFDNRAGFHVPHPSHTTLVVNEIATAIKRLNFAGRPSFSAGHDPSFVISGYWLF